MVMKKIMFLTGPINNSPSWIFANNLIKYLKKDNEICVLTEKNGREEGFDFSTYEDIKFYFVNSFFKKWHSDCENRINNTKNSCFKIIYKLSLMLKRFCFMFSRLFSDKSFSKQLVRNYLKTAHKVVSDGFVPDVLIAVSYPFESEIALLDFKKKYPNCKTMAFSIDFYANEPNLYKMRLFKKSALKKAELLEVIVSKSVDTHFMLSPVYDYFSRVHSSEMSNVVKVGYPLFENKWTEAANNKKVSCIYAGMLNTSMRNPEVMLKLFSSPYARENFELEIYHSGNCHTLIEKYSSGSIREKGRIPLSELQKKVIACDAIVIIGNRNEEIVPSKLYQMLSYGRPIIYFYYNKDIYYQLLSKIDGVVLIENSENSLDCMNVMKEIEKCRGRLISYDDVVEVLKENTLEKVVEQFKKYI